MDLLGPPSVSATLVDQTLAREGLPASGLGATIVAEGRRYGVDPVYVLAVISYAAEHTPLPARGHNAAALAAPSGGYDVFPSWQAGVVAFYHLVRDTLVRRRGVRTLDEMLPLYAPGSRHSVEGELNALRDMIVAWRAMAS